MQMQESLAQKKGGSTSARPPRPDPRARAWALPPLDSRDQPATREEMGLEHEGDIDIA